MPPAARGHTLSCRTCNCSASAAAGLSLLDPLADLFRQAHTGHDIEDRPAHPEEEPCPAPPAATADT